jgi:hypothetical protein
MSAQRLVTFLVFSVSLVLFRAGSLAGAGTLFSALVGAQGGALYDSSVVKAHHLHLVSGLYWIGVGLLVVWGLPNTQQFLRRFRPALDYRYAPGTSSWAERLTARLEWRPHWTYALAIALVFGLGVSAMSKAQAFIYFQF